MHVITQIKIVHDTQGVSTYLHKYIDTIYTDTIHTHIYTNNVDTWHIHTQNTEQASDKESFVLENEHLHKVPL